MDRRDIDAEQARRWRRLLHGDVHDLAAGRHTRPEPPPLRPDLDLLGNREGDRRALARARSGPSWRDSAWFDVLLAAAAGAALLAVCVGLVVAVVYTLVWSLT